MRIALIAMSGVRAASEELMRAGLTMPAVVERGVVVAALPSLSLLTLAGLTPADIEVEYFEIQDLRRHVAGANRPLAGSTPRQDLRRHVAGANRPLAGSTPRRPVGRRHTDSLNRSVLNLPDGFDLVAISTFTAQVRDAYAVADHYRARGVPVVMGGLHVKACPDEAAGHATTIAIGEGELLWPQIIADLRAGRLQARYESPPGVHFDLAAAPCPRHNLLNVARYNRLTVQTARGCPHCCDFCASSILLTPRYSLKPVERVIAEIRSIKRLWDRPFVEFADDNSFASRSHAKALLRALIAEDVRWFTEADISIAADAELLDLMRESGCRQVLIGLESPTPDGLDGIEVKRNWKLARLPDYEAAIDAIQSRGITVNGCFILGLDGDTERTFDAIYDFIDRTALFEAQLTVLTPFPGTPLYERLLREGRLIEPRAWEKCTLFDVNFHPRNMSADRLQQGLLDLARRVYDPAFIHDRRRRFFERLHASGVRPGPGLPAETGPGDVS